MAFIQRFLGALQDALQPRPAETAPAGAQAVGTGARNEVHIEIGGVPNLFRDEGERIVHFIAVFDPRPTPTRFGQKLLPDPVPYWSVAGEHPGAELSGVIATAIREHAPPAVRMEMPGGNGAAQSSHEAQPGAQRAPAATPKVSERRDHASSVYRGTIAFWGEAEFPDRKRIGGTYTSFALKLETATGAVETLQGEGLKDAIAEAGCQLGDRVEVRRLKKVKVPAFHRKSGKPKLDDNGQQVLWDKWLWSIARSH
ncbi:hypothetical protein CNE_BB2p03740 (plasmid) [Cupriavidus necator N-1]|uniref:Uncharacterized protein n=1 Tax=Cupriavidus necator (strain ATCC 43291 / DSM 13513 / CCUG 52238 / LMG 8453 / N-1) TaxID=1042878 RepID=F8GY43_CUPNN|nr:hypothetical protein [Cupriavidus necator]AEI83167.1 hypothetical protein CNE_BB2p03740 [Cupriavidus necator N-1]MDX6008580.1 hypothetical protein [Cupriavidus necator]